MLVDHWSVPVKGEEVPGTTFSLKHKILPSGISKIVVAKGVPAERLVSLIIVAKLVEVSKDDKTVSVGNAAIWAPVAESNAVTLEPTSTLVLVGLNSLAKPSL